MPAGTITLTNNSAIINGAGTSFNTELAGGDMIVAVVGGVTYTLPVKIVDSATRVTLIKTYDGPTQAGAAWSAVPRDTLNAITAQLAAETAKALRGLNYDKDNWQRLFSGTGNISVKLPDGSEFTGPAWNGIITELNEKADKTALGTAAALDVQTSTFDATANRLMTNGAWGLGSAGAFAMGTSCQFLASLGGSPEIPGNGAGWQSAYAATRRAQLFMTTNEVVYSRFSLSSTALDTTTQWNAHYTTKNTTVDSNGFIKRASPIINIFCGGNFKTNDESNGCSVNKISVGEYLISGCIGLNSDIGWGGVDGGFEIPLDKNKQPRIWLDYEVNMDGSILVKTYHRTHPNAPNFARNEIEGYSDCDPIDIPQDSFISVRVEMPE